VHVVREATSRERPRIAHRDILVGASWIVMLVSGLGVLVWWLAWIAATEIALGAGAQNPILSTWMAVAPLGFATVVIGTLACVRRTSRPWSAAAVVTATAAGWLAAGVYGSLTVAPFAIFAVAMAAQRMPPLAVPWRLRYGLLAAGCAWAAALPLAVSFLLADAPDDPRAGNPGLLLSPPPLTAGFTVAWTVATAALVYRAAAAHDCPRLTAVLSAVVCGAGAALTCALVDISTLDIAVAFVLGVLLSPSPRTYGSNAPSAPRFLAPKA
jgi:hypothetical protein